MKKRYIKLLISCFIFGVIDYTIQIYSSKPNSFSYEMSVIAFILITLTLTICLFLFLDEKLSQSISIENEDSIGYLSTGYEAKLLDLLDDNNIKTLFINGEFGFGKSTMLDFVINQKLKEDDSKVLHLKFYDEYIENNYIDFLFEKLLESNNVFIRNYHLLVPYIMVSLVSLLLFGLSEISNKSQILLLALAFLLLTKEILATFSFKTDKVKFIRKELKKYDFVIIDDLDRAYISTKEVLKCVHFLREVYGVKLILLGDSQKFIFENDKEDQALDVLEKYYDYKFDIPRNIILNNIIDGLIQKCEEVYPIEYGDEIGSLYDIWRKMTPRKIIQIINQIEFDSNSVYINYTSALYRSDYLFILTLSINNKIDMLQLNEQIKIMAEKHITYLETKHLNSFRETLTSEKLSLTDLESKYLIECFAYYKGRTVYVDENSIIKNITHIHKVYYNRIFDQPKVYILNSYRPTISSISDIQLSFETWLEEDEAKIGEYEYAVYCEYKGKEEVNNLLLNYMEQREKKRFMYFLKNYILNNLDEVRNTYPNVYFTYQHGKLSSFQDEEGLGELIKEYSGSLDKLLTSNIVEILIMAAHQKNEEIVNYLRKYLNDNDKIYDAFDYLIKRPYPYYIFEMFGTQCIGTESQIKQLLQLRLDSLKNIKENHNYYPREGRRRRRTDEGDTDLKEYNAFKDQISTIYDFDVSEYHFSFDD